MSQKFRTAITGAGVGLALFTLFLGGTAFAQTQSGTSPGDFSQAFVDRLAEKLGISSDELESTMQEAGNEVVDEAIESGDLTEEQGDAMRERIAEGGNFFAFGGPHAFGRGMFGCNVSLETVATELGITEDELRAELESGATLSDIITEHGSTVEDVVAALVTNAEAEVSEAVADGRLTQEQADELLAELPERLTEMIENGMFGGPRHFRPFDGPNSDGDDEATPEETTAPQLSTLWN